MWCNPLRRVHSLSLLSKLQVEQSLYLTNRFKPMLISKFIDRVRWMVSLKLSDRFSLDDRFDDPISIG